MSLPGATFSELINKPDRTVERLTGAHAAAFGGTGRSRSRPAPRPDAADHGPVRRRQSTV